MEKKMKKKSLLGIMLTMSLVIVLFNAIPAKASPGWNGTIKIGAFGPMAWIQGQGINEGTSLAAEQINKGPNGIDDAGGKDDGIVMGGDPYDEIVSPGEKHYKVQIVAADDLRGMPDPTGTTGAAAASELVSAGVQFVVGGFRTESVLGARDVFMDYGKIYVIAGAATNELVYDPTSLTPNLKANYDKYKYMFRATPTNGTELLRAVGGYVKYQMIYELIPVKNLTAYGTPLKIAVITEALTWADGMDYYFAGTTPAYPSGPAMWYYYWNVLLGMSTYGGVSVAYHARISPVTTDVSAELQGVKDSGASLLVSIISGPSGRTMVKQWHDMNVPAFLTGIDVPSQEIPIHWEATGGKCETETSLVTVGTETPATPRLVPFYNAYMAKYGHAPIYLSYGAYDAVIGIEQMLEFGTDATDGNANDPDWWDPTKPMTGLIPYMEPTMRDGLTTFYDYNVGYVANTGINAKFKYTSAILLNGTGGIPAGWYRVAPFLDANATQDSGAAYTNWATAYDAYWNNILNPLGTNIGNVNPTRIGALHDVYSQTTSAIPGQDDAHGPFWTYHWPRSLVGQWQYNTKEGEARIEVVFPLDQSYSTKTKFPTAMYPLAEADIALNGKIDVVGDMAAIGATWLSTPNTAPWIAGYTYLGLKCDMDYDKIITIADASVVAMQYGQHYP